MTRTSTNLSARIHEAIRIQRARIKSFEKDFADELPVSQRDWNDAVKVMAQLIGQARAIVKDGIRWSKSLSPEDMRAVIVDWYAALPPQQQRQLLEELARVDNERPEA